jgi:DNA-binding NtrC family response regulator
MHGFAARAGRSGVSCDQKGKFMTSEARQGPADTQIGFRGANFDKRGRLLVIDDDAVHRIIICKLAQKADLAPYEAENCADVVRLTTANDFECATLDLSLGERAGTEVLRHFSVCGFRAPIVIVSGSDADGTGYALDLGRSLGLNMWEPLPKPVDLSRFRNIFARIGNGWRNAQRAGATAT